MLQKWYTQLPLFSDVMYILGYYTDGVLVGHTKY
jgi:hypothetical protein